MSLDVIFAGIVGVLAALALIGALAFAVVWCAIRRTLAAHRRRAPDGFWCERGALAPTISAERELIHEGGRRILAGHSLREIALDWEGRGLQGRRPLGPLAAGYWWAGWWLRCWCWAWTGGCPRSWRGPCPARRWW